VVEQLDLSGLEESYAGRGSDAHHPAMLVALLLYQFVEIRLVNAWFLSIVLIGAFIGNPSRSERCAAQM